MEVCNDNTTPSPPSVGSGPRDGRRTGSPARWLRR